ncbi:MAG: hypothetical protein JW704_00015 [Anaerolineaceae bacterium]|nr:hypothetical protein [Anaerolineaceae bacterium]
MEIIIKRAEAIMGMGVNEKHAAIVLVESGVSQEDAFLAVKAAIILGANIEEARFECSNTL